MFIGVSLTNISILSLIAEVEIDFCSAENLLKTPYMRYIAYA